MTHTCTRLPPGSASFTPLIKNAALPERSLKPGWLLFILLPFLSLFPPQAQFVWSPHCLPLPLQPPSQIDWRSCIFRCRYVVYSLHPPPPLHTHPTTSLRCDISLLKARRSVSGLDALKQICFAINSRCNAAECGRPVRWTENKRSLLWIVSFQI